MNGPIKQKAQSGRWPLPSAPSCCSRVRGVHIVERSADKTAIGHRDAADCWRRKQWSLTGILALSFRGSWVDQQGSNKAWSGCAAGSWINFLYATGAPTQQDQLVRRHLGFVASSSRHGCRPAIIASRRLQVVEKKHFDLYGIRTNSHPYKYVNRTKRGVRKYGSRSYKLNFMAFLSTDSVHLLDMPSVVVKKQSAEPKKEERAARHLAPHEVRQ